MNFRYYSVILLLFIGTMLAEEVKIEAAVLNLKAVGVNETTAEILSENLRSILYASGRFEVMNREDMQSIMMEQHFQNSGNCDSRECIVQLGLVLGVDKIVNGSIGKLGSTYSITLKIIDIETAKNDKIITRNEKCSEDELFDLIKKSAEELAAAKVINLVSNQQMDKKPLTGATMSESTQRNMDFSVVAGIPSNGLRFKWTFWRGISVLASICYGEKTFAYPHKTQDGESDLYLSSLTPNPANLAIALKNSAPEITTVLLPFQLGLGYDYSINESWNLGISAELGGLKSKDKFNVLYLEHHPGDLSSNRAIIMTDVEITGNYLNLFVSADKTWQNGIKVGMDAGYSAVYTKSAEVGGFKPAFTKSGDDDLSSIENSATDFMDKKFDYRSVLFRLSAGYAF